MTKEKFYDLFYLTGMNLDLYPIRVEYQLRNGGNVVIEQYEDGSQKQWLNDEEIFPPEGFELRPFYFKNK